MPRLIDRPSSDFWSDTIVMMPQDLRSPMRNLLTDRLPPAGNLQAAQLFVDHPISILVARS
ncbi:hypothetical protein PY650_23825 [Rhizobium calliandrae]|uniref:Uncharacterized protein n=1 Tax=Rhizobium calliandrae TaxID=1312182 RepID=A0ABT7KKU9_9HYPH|nr:hypothetical protein [Rhizobium calliandrae]MDL2408620.1 hypothetical protein [Rhizobium calliandrae]